MSALHFHKLVPKLLLGRKTPTIKAAMFVLRKQEGLRHGGLLGLKEDGDRNTELLPEHQDILQKMETSGSVIAECRPGEVVFVPALYGQFFSFPASLSLQSCGFEPGLSLVDKTFATLPPDQLPILLTKEAVLLSLPAMSCPHAFLSWIFQLMSVHPDGFLVRQCEAIISGVLRIADHTAPKWFLDVALITRVFMNLGASRKTLTPRLLIDTESVPPGPAPSHATPSQQGAPQYSVESLRILLQVIADVTYMKSKYYTASDLNLIITMILRVSLDTRLNQSVLDCEISDSISSLLNAFRSEDWPVQLVELSGIAPYLASHHHNMVHVAELLPPCERGRYLQRRVAYAMLYAILMGQDAPKEHFKHFRLHRLRPLLSLLEVRGDADCYLISSLLLLTDLSVGNEMLHSREKEDLKALVCILRSKQAAVWEVITAMDRTLMKNRMVWLTSKWTFMMKSMGSKTKSIFDYVTVTGEVNVETVMVKDHDDSQ